MNLLFSAPSSFGILYVIIITGCSLISFADIVEKDKDAVEQFEYDTSNMTDFDICNDVWKIISE